MPLFKYSVRRLRRREDKYFQIVGAGASTKAIRNELDRLISSVRNAKDRKVPCKLCDMRTNLDDRYVGIYRRNADFLSVIQQIYNREGKGREIVGPYL